MQRDKASAPFFCADAAEGLELLVATVVPRCVA
jgi:hypothetical protein